MTNAWLSVLYSFLSLNTHMVLGGIIISTFLEKETELRQIDLVTCPELHS